MELLITRRESIVDKLLLESITDPDVDGEFYRFVETRYNNFNVVMETYYLVRNTPKGSWITPYKDFHGTVIANKDYERWTSNHTIKRFAYKTKKEALVSYLARKNRHIAILLNTVDYIQDSIEEAKLLMEKLNG